MFLPRPRRIIAAAGAWLAFFALEKAVAGEFSRAWHSENSSIVLDAYEYTPLNWSKIHLNKRLAGFINKASDGLSPSARCENNVLCRVKWRRYVAARELYHTRKVLAKMLGLKWGAYHLARPDNPIEQAQHFLEFAQPTADDLIALDIEHNDPSRWMSLSDAERFARYIKMRTGRYPILYTNHDTAKFIAGNRTSLPLLSRLNLWYARYKPNISGEFPMGNWKSYTLWQFSSLLNCDDKSCPWRINGADSRIDVNVVNMPVDQLKKEWPFDELRTTPTTTLPVARPSNPSQPKSLNIIAGYGNARQSSLKAKSAPANSLGSIPVETSSYATLSETPPVMAISEGVITPTWRPGATIARHLSHKNNHMNVR